MNAGLSFHLFPSDMIKCQVSLAKSAPHHFFSFSLDSTTASLPATMKTGHVEDVYRQKRN